MRLKNEWENILDYDKTIYIFGAGKYGKKLLKLIDKSEKKSEY